MDEEMNSIDKKDTWDLVELLDDKYQIRLKWVYKKKLNEKGEVEKYKVILVKRGFSYYPRVDYGETLVTIARSDIVTGILAVTTHNRWKVQQMDVKATLLNGILEEEAYVQQPPLYEIKFHKDKVYILNKSLYGLKQAPRAWYNRIDSYQINNGFKRSRSEPILYTKVNKQGQFLMSCMYVDDMTFIGNILVE